MEVGVKRFGVEMKRTFANYTAWSVLCVGVLLTGTAALAQDSTAKGSQSPARQTQSPGFEPGPGPSGSRPDTTGTPGSMTSHSGKSTKQQMKECVAHTRASNTALSESDAKKSCQEALKAQKESPHKEKPQ
jgi:hypothetical protein